MNLAVSSKLCLDVLTSGWPYYCTYLQRILQSITKMYDGFDMWHIYKGALITDLIERLALL